MMMTGIGRGSSSARTIAGAGNGMLCGVFEMYWGPIGVKKAADPARTSASVATRPVI